MIETGLENHRNGLEKVLNLVLRKVWEPWAQELKLLLIEDNYPFNLHIINNAMAADGLATQGARSSAAMVLS